MKVIAGKVVLLTGASRGIGRFIARALAREQATVVGVSRSLEELDKMIAEIESVGGKGAGIPFDLKNLEELPTLVREIERIVGSVDILVNNAGIEKYGALKDYSLEEIQSTLSVNLLAAIELTRLVLPEMLNRGSGHIVNIASLAAKKGHPYDSIYSASKAGLLMWSDALRQELVGTGVGVSTICPGYISQVGMFANTGIPAPGLAGTSQPVDVANAVIRAIAHNKAEMIVNQDAITAAMAKLLFAMIQFFPRLGDGVYRWIGVTRLNQIRGEKRLSDNNIKDRC